MTPAQFNLYGWQCMGWGLVAIWGTCLRTGTRVLSLGGTGLTDHHHLTPNKTL